MYAVNYSNDDSYSVLIFARAAVKPKYSHAIAGEFMGVFTYQSSNSSLDSCAQSIIIYSADVTKAPIKKLDDGVRNAGTIDLASVPQRAIQSPCTV